jgi:hypothetical protein
MVSVDPADLPEFMPALPEFMPALPDFMPALPDFMPAPNQGDKIALYELENP